MNFFTKTRVLIGAVIVLAALNVATLMTIGFHYKRMKEFTPPTLPGCPEELRHTNFMSRELNLDQLQTEEFQNLREQFQRNTRELREQIRETNRTSMLELTSDSPNDLRLDSLSNEIARLHKEQFKMTIEHFNRVKSVCKPEQQRHLRKMFLRMMPMDEIPRDRQQYMHAKRRERFKNEEKKLTD